MDGKTKIARFNSFDPTKGIVKHVQDISRGVTHRFEMNELCSIDRMSSAIFLKYTHAFRAARSVQEILHMEGDFYYLGTSKTHRLYTLVVIIKFNSKGYQRGILCDIWEQVITDKTKINLFTFEADDKAETKLAPIDKAVITHYFNTVSIRIE